VSLNRRKKKEALLRGRKLKAFYQGIYQWLKGVCSRNEGKVRLVPYGKEGGGVTEGGLKTSACSNGKDLIVIEAWDRSS